MGDVLRVLDRFRITGHDIVYKDYKEEYKEVGVHHSCILFSYEDLERGKFSLLGEDISGLTIYRGWVMKPEMYSNFYTLLEQRDLSD